MTFGVLVTSKYNSDYNSDIASSPQPFGTRPVSHVAIFSADLASVCKPCSRLGLNESFLVVAAMAC